MTAGFSVGQSTPCEVPPRAIAGGAFSRVMESRANRYRLYAVIAVGLFVLSWAAVAMKSRDTHGKLDFVVSDAEGYYVYLPSLAVYGNFDFTESIAEHQARPLDPLEFSRVGHRLRNRWPLGVSLTLAPAFFLAHGASLLLYRITGSQSFLPHGYSILYQLFCQTFALSLGYASMLLADDLLARHFRLRGWSIAMGIATYWIGSNYAYYYFREPFMAHMISASWVILAVWLVERIVNRLQDGRVAAWEWLALGASCGTAIVCRYTDAVLIAPLIYLAWEAVRYGAVSKVLRVVPLALIGLGPIVAQLAIGRLATGAPVHNVADVSRPVTEPKPDILHSAIGYNAYEGFHWGQPALLSTLVSPIHGLLSWSPVLLLGLAGIGWYLTQQHSRRDGLFLSIVAAGLALWYLNSAWYAWTFGDSFGARAFVDLAIVFIVGMALGFEWVGTLRLRGRQVVVGLVLLAIAYNWGLIFLYMTHRISRKSTPWVRDRPHVATTPTSSRATSM